MLTKEFNELPLAERNKLVFGEAKLIDIFDDNKFQKVFFCRMDELKIDIIYDKAHNRLMEIVAWENVNDRVDFLKMPVEYKPTSYIQ